MPPSPFLGEFLGTLILVLFGCGVCAAASLEKSKAKNAGWLAITIGWAIAVFCGIFVAKALGAPGSLNPVGPLASIVQSQGELNANLAMILGQFLGAFCGAALVWLHYLPHWSVTPDAAAKLGVFCTSPAIRDPMANLLSEIIATFALVFVASAIGKLYAGSFEAPLIGVVVWGVGLCLGGSTGYAINPARDLAPRIAHAVLPIPGKGGSDWSYAWIPVIGPCIGGVLAALLFSAIK